MGNLSTKFSIQNAHIYGIEPREGKVYIYMLFLDLDSTEGLAPKIFYVGKSTNPMRRFKGHKQIAWYNAKFDQPVKIEIAGIVSTANADAAEQNLVNRVQAAGYKLTNTVYNMEDRTNWTTVETKRYFNDELRSQKYLVEWRAKWMPPTVRPRQPPSVPKPTYEPRATHAESYSNEAPQYYPAKPYTIWNVPRSAGLTPLYNVKSSQNTGLNTSGRSKTPIEDAFRRFFGLIAVAGTCGFGFIVWIFSGDAEAALGSTIIPIFFFVILAITLAIQKMAASFAEEQDRIRRPR